MDADIHTNPVIMGTAENLLETSLFDDRARFRKHRAGKSAVIICLAVFANATSNEASGASSRYTPLMRPLSSPGSLGSPELTLTWLVIVRGTGLSASRPLQAHGGAVEQLPLCGGVVRVPLVGVWVDVATVAVVTMNR